MAGVLDASSEYSIIATDLDGRIRLWNEGARRLYGYEPEEMIGREYSCVLHVAEDVEAGLPFQIARAALRDGSWEGTVARLRKSGERFVARLVNNVHLDEAGRPVGFVLISRDLSQEQRLTEELKATHFYTRSVIESNVDALVITDDRGTITDVNAQMAVLTGRPREDLIGSPFSSYFTEPGRAQECIRMVVAEGQVTNCELTARAPDGKLTPVSYNASVLYDEHGRLRGVLALGRDVTEQTDLERRLRDQEIYLRGLIERSVDGLVTVDVNGIVTDVNQAMCDAFGFSREEVMGTDGMSYLVDPELASRGLARALDGDVITDFRLRARRQTGEEVVMSFNASPFRDDAGNILGVFASARDVTEQARLQAELSDERTYHRSLFEASADALFAIDRDGVITDLNEAATRLTGFSREYLTNRLFAELFTDPDLVSVGVQRVLSKGSPLGRELELKSSTGQLVPVSFNAGILSDAQGNPVGILAASRDISDLKRAEERMRFAGEEAERANRAKSEFLSRLSHELRTPLNAILGFAQLLEMDDLVGEPSERVQRISKAGRHLLGLINEVLDVSRIEAGQIALSLEPVNMADLVRDTRQLVGALCEQAGIELHITVADDHWALVDSQRFRQILLNLISNAVKYNRPGGTVLVTSTVVDHNVQVRVSDTGPGLPQDRLAELFLPFNRLGADASDIEGSGLGLSLSRALAEAMGGWLLLETTSAEGTTFLVQVDAVDAPRLVSGPAAPLSPSARSSAESPSQSEDSRSTRDHQVLYIEDDEDNVSLVADVLRKRPGRTLIAARDGSQGFALARTARPSLILLDVHLPDISGEEILRRLKSDPRTASIPVVMLTADAINSNAEDSISHGARAHLTKPIDVSRLLDVVDMVLAEVEGI